MAIIYIYNTLTGKKEKFKPIIDKKVGIYNCGPTVYDTVHIGNLRANVNYDIIRRVFEYNNYFVTQIMNITDVDDKTIRRSKEKNISLEELTRHYQTLFMNNLHSLNILTPHKLLSARDYVKDMIEMISILLEKDMAYQSKDGIYFSIGKFKDYGKLAKIDLNNEVRERISNDEYEKENPRDFALWKFWTEDDGVVVWDAPFGKGRPGWHIECSAMATRTLGPNIDIHSGGVDLIFPHHTNEIAQSESCTDKPFVNYWIHNAFVNVNNAKMAKSQNNFYKLADLENMDISPLAFRYWLLTAHYRSAINFTIEAVKASQTAFIRLIETFIRLDEVKNEHIHKHGESIDYKGEFLKRINDDFNTPEAIALVWDLIKDHSLEAKEKVNLLLDFDKVLGFGLQGIKNMKDNGEINPKSEIPDEIKTLGEARQEARKNKEWEKADALRKEIESRGFEIKDIADNGFELRGR